MKTTIISPSNSLWKETLQRVAHDIYHLPEYIILESQRNQTIPEAVIIEDGERIFFVPYLLRKCDDIVAVGTFIEEGFDVISPYGYPGILLNDAARSTSGFPDRAMDEFIQVLAAKKVCSAFFRLHPILNHDFQTLFLSHSFTENGETVSIDLTISEAEMWTHTRKGHRSTINKCKRLGFVPKIVPFLEYVDEFTEIYQETMRRVSASESYYSFNTSYFLEMHDALRDCLHLCIVEFENEVACAGLYTECCQIVQSTLGGTKDKFVMLSPSSLETDYARCWAKARNNQFLHLGGGVGGSKDSVYNFKAGFAKARHTFLTQRLILNEEKYRYLVELRAKFLNVPVSNLLQSSFFPAYRLDSKGQTDIEKSQYC
ncbi:MAG: hypothetical protein CLLPBCKN_003397 [Chroococcidiopsis cubana SAG 39.79]|uniref:FemAB family protein n=1 Tax=Chroococcidiopsis cubana SAG 39.79 TaxID=388085 RepID=A0AB37UI34_9CYAN|nr:FemAB family protein [Chroococcidiopsis cubana]MDZ4874001.1 hypothetical protein [Chroococcidiopsis cubana SAG 39.79]PSB61960.1 FemAB family protein [Chroococcidiopsis cubana CCALA 043]RUT11042.1 hypothetical protein DSM107010_36760 [Chroococcidiopsis cubana SAG 39.79]